MSCILVAQRQSRSNVSSRGLTEESGLEGSGKGPRSLHLYSTQFHSKTNAWLSQSVFVLNKYLTNQSKSCKNTPACAFQRGLVTLESHNGSQIYYTAAKTSMKLKGYTCYATKRLAVSLSPSWTTMWIPSLVYVHKLKLKQLHRFQPPCSQQKVYRTSVEALSAGRTSLSSPQLFTVNWLKPWI